MTLLSLYFTLSLTFRIQAEDKRQPSIDNIMPGFQLYTSNRQEELINYLACHVLAVPLKDPLATELIVVQHQGIQRWVSLEITHKLGILANTRFLFPNELTQIVFEAIVPGYRDTWNTEQLQWLLFEQLLRIPEDPEFNLLKGFQSTNKELRSFQLAMQLADLLDQYDMFRPEMIEKWDRGEDNRWQAKLYRSLPTEVRDRRKSRILKLFCENLDKVVQSLINIPDRISFFGISYLPPLHLEIIKGLSQLIDIHFFFLNPSPWHWGYLHPKKRIIKESLKQQKRIKEDLHYEEGNALLASWGTYGQEFFNLLYDLDLCEEVDKFIKEDFPHEKTEQAPLLSRIQQDIFELANPERDSENNHFNFLKTDNSLQVHSCHSPMREVEVLQASLLMMFSKEDIKPEDVLVMTPDIDHYAPLIQSVFPGDAKEKNYIPYSITDRVFIKESVVIQYFLKLFEVAQSRFSISNVFSLMASKAIRDKFQLSDTDLNLVQEWLESVNVRWGINAEFRKDKGVPATYENTWEYGIDRILTGFGIPGQEQHLVQENTSSHLILPFDNIEGNNALIFGRFLDYYDFLSSLAAIGKESIFNQRTLTQWSALFEESIQFLFKDHPDWSEELQILKQSFEQLIKIEKVDGFTETIGIDVLLDFFQTKFNGILNERGYLGRGVTFAAMKPMRSVPFKVIALIGMNDKSFPRTDQPLSFDLAGSPVRGDRSVKGEDRYMFLETLISARKKLYLSYIGQSIKDNSTLSPSTLISELLDYIEQAYLTKEDIKNHVMINHPLQAFNPRNFLDDTSLFSFSNQNLDAAKTLLNTKKQLRSDFTLDLPDPEKSFKEMTIKNLTSFFDNPSKFILYHRLKIYLEDEKEEQLENEPFDLDFLAKYTVEGDILNSLIYSKPKKTIKQIIKSKGMLPHALAGERLFDDLYEDLSDFRQEIEPYLNQAMLDPVPYQLNIGHFVLSGTIQTAGNKHLVRFRQARVKVKDRIRSWLEHLVINCVKPEGYPLESVLIGKDSKNNKVEVFKMTPVKNPENQLKEILDIYYSGLSQGLAFFPRSADAYMKVYQKSAADDEQAARENARKEAAKMWDGNPNMKGESENAYFQLCFGRQSLFADTDFEANCLNILKPIYENQLIGEED